MVRTKKGSEKQKDLIGTKVKRESSVKKNEIRVYRKRLLMLRRRISVLLGEKESWEEKNREIIDNYNTEKKLNAELQKDVHTWQRLYHEAVISQNTYKVKHAEMVQNVSLCLKDIKAVFPHMLGLSDTICRNQGRLTNLLNASHPFDTKNHIPQAFGDGRQVSNDLSKRSEKRMRHKVGPMVNGVLIQKPTIRLERVMLHQPQGQEPTNNDLTPERGDALTPIVEEDEPEIDLHLEQISMRRRRKLRLGLGERWRMRKQQEQLEKERQMERERERENQRHSVSESSDSEDHLGPVIRLQRVSGLLLGSNLLEVDRGRASEGKGAASRSTEPESRRLRTGEDPKEGCSWMHINPGHSKKKSSEKKKPESSASSDSSDEDSDSLIVVPEKKGRNSLSSSLYKNNTYTMKRKTSSSSSLAELSHDAFDSSKVEPDSTNNIDDMVFPRVSGNDSLGMNASTKPTGASSVINGSLKERGSVANDRTLCGITPLDTTDPARPSQDQRRSSNFCNNCTPITSSDIQGKRIRKPNSRYYPVEEPENTVAVSKVKKGKPVTSSNKVLHSKLSAGRKTLGKRSSKISEESTSSDQQPPRGRSSDTSQEKRAVGRPKKSSIKMNSVEMPRTSADLRLSEEQEESDGRKSRRNKGPMSYKEPSANKKLRRPK